MAKLINRWIRKISPLDLILVLVLLLLTVSFTLFYFSRERFFYYWDWSRSQSVTNAMASLFPNHPRQLFNALRASLPTDYNNYYSIPLLPIIWLLKPDRLSFLAAVSILYQFPYILSIGFLFQLTQKKSFRGSFWIAILAIILIPNVWKASLRGYPDAVAGLFFGLALCIFIWRYPNNYWWQYVLTGFALAWSAIFRRYFAYNVIAFFLSTALLLFLEFFYLVLRRKPKAIQASPASNGEKTSSWFSAVNNEWRAFFKQVLFTGLAGVSGLLTLAIFNFPFLRNGLQTDYNQLYQSYLISWQQAYIYFKDQFGLILWILAIIGFGLAFMFSSYRRKLAFVFVNCLGLLVLWFFQVRQLGVHYLIAPAMFLAFGVSWLLFITITKTRSVNRCLAVVLLVSFLAYNFLQCFGVIHPVNLGVYDQLFSAKHLPLYRGDYDEVIRLVNYLRDIVRPGELVYAADSSDVMNSDILRKAEDAYYPTDKKLFLLDTPHIDSRDYYPLANILKADYVVVSDPFQYHLGGGNKQGQKVVQVVYESFRDHRGVALDFERMHEQFLLSNGNVTLSVYKRVRETTPEQIVSSFYEMVEYVGLRPGLEKDWISIQKSSYLDITKENDGSYSLPLTADIFSSNNKIAILSTWPAPSSGTTDFKIDNQEGNVPEIKTFLSIYDRSGSVVFRSADTLVLGSSTSSIKLSYSVDNESNPGPYYMVLSIEKNNQDTPDTYYRFIIHYRVIAQ